MQTSLSHTAQQRKVLLETRASATRRRTIFRDHFVIVGPVENPANISDSSKVSGIMASILQAAEKNNASTTIPTRWLSRHDKSVTNIKESQLWLGIGQVCDKKATTCAQAKYTFRFPGPPPTPPGTTRYHKYITFPIQALTTAIVLLEYTLTDRGTCLSLPPLLANQSTIYKAGSDDADEPLLNPAHLLVGKKAQNSTMAYGFAAWATGYNGQKVITDFKNGQQLYSGAP